MIDELRKVLALSALLSVLVAALFSFGSPVRAQDATDAANGASTGAVDAQQQANTTYQAASTMGVPQLRDNAQR